MNDLDFRSFLAGALAMVIFMFACAFVFDENNQKRKAACMKAIDLDAPNEVIKTVCK